MLTLPPGLPCILHSACQGNNVWCDSCLPGHDFAAQHPCVRGQRHDSPALDIHMQTAKLRGSLSTLLES